MKKGSQVYVEGRLQTRNWEDQQGQKHYKTEVVVTTMQFLDTKSSEGGDPPVGGSSDYLDSSATPQASSSSADSENGQKAPQDDEFIKDDIPF